MKTKDIKAGVAYAKREKNKYSTEWGVAVTTEFLYEYLSYGSKDKVYAGSSVLVLTNRAYGSGVRATLEDAIAAASTVRTAKTLDMNSLNYDLAKRGLILEIWLPRDFEGAYEEVKAERDADRLSDQNARKSASDEASDIKAQMERITADLGIKAYAYADSTKREVKMSFSQWKELMDRVEALVVSDPLCNGKL